ncbi:MAG: hypothetical protein K2N91_00535 [Muribaculaceae bacterium]|nr:hypothetical protein [Muribaculaceae bacterium]
MKIKDIINKNWNFKTRLLIARRISKCTTLIKRDIAAWKRDRMVPERALSLQINGVENMRISVHELMDTYGMDPLSAMLFFDDLIKANNNEDKTQMVNLVERLQSGGRRKSLAMTPDMLENIKNNQPELWREYERLQKDEDMLSGEEEIEQIEETELPD